MELIAFQFTWPTTGTSSAVTIPVAMSSLNYVVTSDFEDLTGASAILRFPAAGRTTGAFNVEASGTITSGTKIGFIVNVI